MRALVFSHGADGVRTGPFPAQPAAVHFSPLLRPFARVLAPHMAVLHPFILPIPLRVTLPSYRWEIRLNALRRGWALSVLCSPPRHGTLRSIGDFSAKMFVWGVIAVRCVEPTVSARPLGTAQRTALHCDTHCCALVFRQMCNASWLFGGRFSAPLAHSPFPHTPPLLQQGWGHWPPLPCCHAFEL